MNSNRCPKCGGVANHTLTNIEGRNYYRCMTGLTSFESIGLEISRVSHIIPCDTLIDQQGKIFNGIIAYATGNGLKTLVVTMGKI